MEVGALVPEDSGGEQDLSPRQVEAVYALLKRFGKGKGKAVSRRPLLRRPTAAAAARARAREARASRGRAG
eukprot:10991237-Alexandrium_andersonii.AAC.1